MSTQRVLLRGSHMRPQRTLKSACQRLNHRSPTYFSRIQAQTQCRKYSITPRTLAQYPTREEITDIFKNMESGNYSETFKHVRNDVDWTVMGTHPLAGNYKNLKDFQQATFARLAKIMKDPGIRLKVKNVIGGGDQAWSNVELYAEAECLNGMNFDNKYSWCMRFDDSGKIAEVRAYLDSQMVKQAIEENETHDDANVEAPVLAS